jgi:hypothetical protein
MPMQLLPCMAMPEFWYDPPSEARDMASRERALAGHATMLGASVLVLALIVAALFLVHH